MPALNSARERGRSASCINNLKQLNNAFMGYVDAFEDYFPQGTLQYIVKQPISLLEVDGKYDVFVNVVGGGYTGQAGAIRLGIARALLEAEENCRPVLKAAGFLTRDPRAKERKKYGLKKARRAPQFSKR